MGRPDGKNILTRSGARGQETAEGHLFIAAEGARVAIGDLLEAKGGAQRAGCNRCR
jgi:hypothetical protein